MIWLVAAAVFLPMIAEARLAQRNEAKQRARGGSEPHGDVYPLMRIAYPATFVAMIVEGASRDARPDGLWTTGAVVFAASKVLKWWAIRELGERWTFRVIVRAGVPLVATGPYRLVRHPNYVAVIGELGGVALMTRACFAGPLGTVLFGLLLVKRIRVETAALAGAASMSANIIRR